MVATSTYNDGLVTHEYTYKVPQKKEIFLSCSCESEVVRISKFEDEEEIYLTVYSFSAQKYSFWQRLKILFGKKTKVVEIILNKEEFNKLKNF